MSIMLWTNAGLGVTKLELLTHVSAPERAEFAAENDLAGMTVEDLVEDLVGRDDGGRAACGGLLLAACAPTTC